MPEPNYENQQYVKSLESCVAKAAFVFHLKLFKLFKISPHKCFCLSQDSIQSVIIKEEGLEVFADQMSPDSGHCRDQVYHDDDDPDYQVGFMDT